MTTSQAATDLSGRVAVVTGGNGGIGLAMAEAMAHAGADIAVWGRNTDKNAAAVDYLGATGRNVMSVGVDVADEAQVADAFAQTISELGRADIMFANAGVTSPGKMVADSSLDEWRHVMGVNLDGVFLCFREASKHLIEKGEGGSLVVVSSTASIHGAASNASYSASKTGVLGLMRAMAVEMARYNVRVNALLPGWTKTDLASFGFENDRFREATTKRTPVRRWAEPSEMAAAALFLADPALTFHTGDTITVDGGYTIY